MVNLKKSLFVSRKPPVPIADVKSPIMKVNKAAHLVDKNSQTIVKIAQLMDLMNQQGGDGGVFSSENVLLGRIGKLKKRLNRRLYKLAKWSDMPAEDRLITSRAPRNFAIRQQQSFISYRQSQSSTLPNSGNMDSKSNIGNANESSSITGQSNRMSGFQNNQICRSCKLSINSCSCDRIKFLADLINYSTNEFIRVSEMESFSKQSELYEVVPSSELLFGDEIICIQPSDKPLNSGDLEMEIGSTVFASERMVFWKLILPTSPSAGDSKIQAIVGDLCSFSCIKRGSECTFGDENNIDFLTLHRMCQSFLIKKRMIDVVNPLGDAAPDASYASAFDEAADPLQPDPSMMVHRFFFSSFEGDGECDGDDQDSDQEHDKPGRAPWSGPGEGIFMMRSPNGTRVVLQVHQPVIPAGRRIPKTKGLPYNIKPAHKLYRGFHSKRGHFTDEGACAGPYGTGSCLSNPANRPYYGCLGCLKRDPLRTDFAICALCYNDPRHLRE